MDHKYQINQALVSVFLDISRPDHVSVEGSTAELEEMVKAIAPIFYSHVVLEPVQASTLIGIATFLRNLAIACRDEVINTMIDVEIDKIYGCYHEEMDDDEDHVIPWEEN